MPVRYRALLAYASGRIDAAAAITDSLRRARPTDSDVQIDASFALGNYAAVRGRVAEARRWWRGAHEARRLAGVTREPLSGATQDALAVAWFLDGKERAVRALDSALARQPLDSIPAADRPLVDLAITYAVAGRPDRARAMLAEFDRSRASLARRYDALARHAALGFIALAERRYGDGVREFRDADGGGCVICALPDLARSYDLAGQADSAIAVYERYVRTPGTEHEEWDATYLAGAHKRLGELYEAKGDHADASRHYTAFVALWRDADPALQPAVAEVRARLAQLGAAEPR
jgi:tetratricopeptide (TPR) repeat protein